MKQDHFEPGYFYHVYNRGNNHENIFKEERNYSFFLTLVRKHLLQVCDIYCYCLMPNHFHFLLKIKEPEDIPEQYQSLIHQPFSNLFNSYSKSINKAYHRSGSLFQEHLHRKRITNEKYLYQVIAYIHLNPQKHGFVSDFKEYPNSSYSALISFYPTCLRRKEVLELFFDYRNFIYWHDEKRLRLTGIMEEIEKEDI